MVQVSKHRSLRINRRTGRIIGIICLTLLLGVLAFRAREQHASAPKQETTPDSSETERATENTSQNSETNTPDTAPVASFSTTDPSSIWVIVNKQHPLSPTSYTPTDLVGIGSGQLARNAAASALASLFAAAKSNGTPIYVLSGYRSYATQSGLYNNYVQTDGQTAADTYSARPGYSEHQTGLAADVGTGTCDLDICFGNTDAGKWVAANAYKYGLIVRYPADKTTTTGYQYEPWHLRYVGVELATDMHDKGISTLEEYFGSGGTSY
ncbi:M15 family metallopeptidase [Candidatus Saccharibacteria bacterium]|nr:M15 family metallopeptidase [Candidatus Saccharibacteria bacterium]